MDEITTSDHIEIEGEVFKIMNLEENSCEIVTFDGFNLTLQQKSKALPLGAFLNPAENPSKLTHTEDSNWEYFMIIYELDVELKELESLI